MPGHTQPDFQRLRTALMGGQPDRVPLVELFVDPAVRQAFLGRPADNLAAEIEFYAKAGYDAIKISPLVDINPGRRESRDRRQITSDRDFDRDRQWAPQHAGMITSRKELESYRWPRPEEIDYGRLEEAARLLPPGMAIIGQYGDIFTWAWTLMGFETFSFALVDRPDLVEQVMSILGELITGMFAVMAQMDRVGALWYTDDLAFKTGLLVSPDVYRKHLFPWMKKIGQICQEGNR